jgi:hypothetical protein
MYYQTESVSKDHAPTACTIVGTTEDNKYIIEYSDSNGEFKTKQINPEELQKLEYSELDISQ